MNNEMPVIAGVIMSVVCFCFGFFMGNAECQNKAIEELSKHCVVECGRCGGINRVIPQDCIGKTEMVNALEQKEENKNEY